MRTAGHGAHFQPAISGKPISFVGYSFVDDTDICQTSRSASESASSVVAHMQAAMDCWEGGIRATGGAIVPAKSHWYLLDFVWRNGSWLYASHADSPGTIHVQDTDGRRHTLERLAPSEARRTL
jgi:hypothetical protein